MKQDIESHWIKFPIELTQICGLSATAVYAVLLDASYCHIATLSNKEIGKRIGLPYRSIPAIISKLEKLGIIERRYNAGYPTSYYIKNIMIDEAAAPNSKPPSRPEPKPESEQEPKKTYGECGNVELTDSEYSKLIQKHGETMANRAIERMDEYCQSYGRKYNDCYYVLERWIKKGIFEFSRGKAKRMNADSIRQQELDEIKKGKYMELVNDFDRDDEIFRNFEEQRQIEEKYEISYDQYLEIQSESEKSGKSIIDIMLEIRRPSLEISEEETEQIENFNLIELFGATSRLKCYDIGYLTELVKKWKEFYAYSKKLRKIEAEEQNG